MRAKTERRCSGKEYLSERSPEECGRGGEEVEEIPLTVHGRCGVKKVGRVGERRGGGGDWRREGKWEG